MPSLSQNEIDALLKIVAGSTGFAFEVMDEFRQYGLGSNLSLLAAAAQLPPSGGALGQVRLSVERWIDQRLRATRQVGGQTPELFAARKLLDILASIELGLEGPGDVNEGLSIGRIEYALRRLEVWAPLGRSPEILSLLRRTGIVNPTGGAQVLSYPGLAPSSLRGLH